MQNKTNRHTFTILSIFFIIITPFIVVLSLGYNVDIRNQVLLNRTSINLETVPIGARVQIDEGMMESSTPTSVNLYGQKTFDLDIEKDGFMDESFTLYSSTNSNSFINLSTIRLLPTKPETVFNLLDNDVIQIMSSNRAILQSKTDNSFYVASFGAVGFQYDPDLIVENYPIQSAKSSLDFDLNSSIKEVLLDTQEQWMRLSSRYFWKKNVFLVNNGNYWSVLDLSVYNVEQVKSAALLPNNELVILDSDNNLWSWSLEKNIFRFIDNRFQGMAISSDPYLIWLADSNGIYKISSGIDLEDIDFDEYLYFSFTESSISNLYNLQKVIDNPQVIFEAKKVAEGFVFLVDKILFYVPEYRSTLVHIMSLDAEVFTTSDDSLFWLESTKQLKVHNFYSRYLKIISQNMPFAVNENIEMVYSKDWDRLMFYVEDRVYSIWINKDFENVNILNYSLVPWISGSLCYTKVNDYANYCVEDNKLTIYKNKALF